MAKSKKVFTGFTNDKFLFYFNGYSISKIQYPPVVLKKNPGDTSRDFILHE